MELGKPHELGFDGARLARIDAFLKEAYLDTGRLKNTQILVARDGQPVHYGPVSYTHLTLPTKRIV